MTEYPTQDEHLARVQEKARELTGAVQAAENAGVSPALVLPVLYVVFKEAGMLPDSLDLGGLLGMVSG